jgi:hypothetical protein
MNLREAVALAKQEVNKVFAPNAPKDVVWSNSCMTITLPSGL